MRRGNSYTQYQFTLYTQKKLVDMKLKLFFGDIGKKRYKFCDCAHNESFLLEIFLFNLFAFMFLLLAYFGEFDVA